MLDAEFEHLLTVVDEAMTQHDAFDLDWSWPHGDRLPRPANDNDGPWPLFPFPDGSMASC